MPRIVFNDAELNQLLGAPSGPVGRDLLRRAGNVRVRAEGLANDRLKRSTRAGVHYHDSFVHGIATSPLIGFAGNNAEHALGLEVGNRPHIIRASRAPFLHFYSAKSGRWVRTREVHHPGSRSYAILASALPAAAS